jgi:type I restriction enzyme S subunit
MKKGWEIKKLGDLCELITKGTTPTSLGFDFTIEGVKFIKVESLTESGKIIPNKVAYISQECHNSLKRSQLKENDILFSIAGALGRIGIVNKDILPANTNQALAIIRLKSGINLKIDFLSKYFQSNIIKEEIEKLKGGAAQQNLSLTQLNNLNVPIPPLSAQQEIVSILNDAFESIERAKSNAEQNLKNAKELFESYLANIFKSPSKEWIHCKIEDHIKLIDYRGRTPVKTIKGVRLITAKNVKLGYLQLEPQEFINSNDYESWMTRGIPNKGDVIFTTEAPLANIAQIDTDEKLAFAQRIIVMQPNLKLINQTFLKYMLLSNPVRNEILSKGTGATVLGIKSSLLKKIKMYFPNLDEQQRIINILDELTDQTKSLQSIYQQKLNDLEELKKSILQKAFNGELKTSKIST